MNRPPGIDAAAQSFKDMDGTPGYWKPYTVDAYKTKVLNKCPRTGNFLWESTTVMNAGTRGTVLQPKFLGCRCQQFLPSAAYEGNHIVPQGSGGSHSISNLEPMCAPCNRGNPQSNPRTTTTIADRTRGSLAESGRSTQGLPNK